MPESFGARMREQRERQQVALSTIAEQTKIKVSLLEALERDDVSRWPSGIFRRAFVRAYAHAIGLEPDSVLREFLEIYPDPPEVIADALANGSEDGRTSDAAPMRFKYLVASAIGSVSRLRARSTYRPQPFAQSVAPVAEEADVVDVAGVDDLAGGREPLPVHSHPLIEDEQPVEDVAVNAEPAAPILNETEPAVAAEPVAQPPIAVRPPETCDRDLMAVAHLCTEFTRVQGPADVPPLLQEMTRILDATGVIVWLWDPIATELRPALTHGYSDRVVAQLPRVERETNNATAAAFRAERTCVVRGDDVDNGALAIPLMGPGGCFGVLATELAERREEKESVRAYATIFAAQLATLIGTAQPIEVSDRRFA